MLPTGRPLDSNPMFPPREYHQDCDIPPEAPVNVQNAQRLANLRLDTPGDTPDSFGEGNSRQALRLDRKKDNRTLAREYNAWLQSMPTWKHGLGSGWVGTRVLGRGGFGIAGLWTYQSVFTSAGDSPLVKGKRRRTNFKDGFQIVVKQQRAGRNGGMEDEARIHAMLNRTNSQHIPRLYKRVYRDIGSGVPGMRIDSNRREVHRMFIEFCAGGDMHDLIKTCRRQGPAGVEWRFLKEDACWSIFDCFARAFFAMQWGEEDPDEEKSTPLWEGRGLVHCDLKPNNVFVGERDGALHSEISVHKIGDFGLTVLMPEVDIQDKSDVMLCAGRGTTNTLAPEQYRFSKQAMGVDANNRARYTFNRQLPPEQRKYGPWTNVYQIGCCMYLLMSVTTLFPYRGCTFWSQASKELRKGETIGEDLELGIFPPDHPRFHSGPNEGEPVPDDVGNFPERIKTPYSKKLTCLVLQCLMQDYRLRPTLQDLREEIKETGYLTGANDREAGHHPWATVGDKEPVADGKTSSVYLPSSWKTSEPKNYWRPARVAHAVHQPLPELLQLQSRDRARKRQVLAARRFLGWPEGAHRAPNPYAQIKNTAIPAPRGIRRGHSQVDQASNSKAVNQIKRRTIAKPALDPTFVLEYKIFNDRFEVPKLERQSRLSIISYAAIGLFRRKIHDSNFPFQTDRIRICTPGAVPGTLMYDIGDFVVMRDAAMPSRAGPNALLVGYLEVHAIGPAPAVTPLVREDVEMCEAPTIVLEISRGDPMEITTRSQKN